MSEKVRSTGFCPENEGSPVNRGSVNRDLIAFNLDLSYLEIIKEKLNIYNLCKDLIRENHAYSMRIAKHLLIFISKARLLQSSSKVSDQLLQWY